jgi:outer membrane protein assembly factor BamE (lipoprotein component of BamABCDE complex)
MLRTISEPLTPSAVGRLFRRAPRRAIRRRGVDGAGPLGGSGRLTLLPEDAKVAGLTEAALLVDGPTAAGRRPARIRSHAALAVVVCLALGGCIGETINRGYVLTPETLEQLTVGASREQVLLSLGSPSTTGTLGGEVFYYISQKASRPVAFMNPEITDQRVLAIYFDTDGRVSEVAEYGMKDGKVFDFLSRKTPTGGADYGFIGQILRGATKVGPSL